MSGHTDKHPQSASREVKLAQVFGHLTVAQAPEICSLTGQWKCVVKCDCGSEPYTLSVCRLLAGTETCRVCQRSRTASTVKIGETFSEFTVSSEPTWDDKNSHWICEAKCKCGVIKVVQLSKLIKSATKSCGCLRKRIHSLVCRKW